MMQTKNGTAVRGETTGFGEEQYDEGYPAGVENHFWHVARNAIIAAQLRRAAMDAMPLLEIGCGRGIVVDYLRQRGIDCIGCDPATPRVDSHLVGHVLPRTDFRDLPKERRETIRGVLLCDVLEHIPTQGELLRDVIRHLPSLTRILVTVPARMELWSDWDVHYGHFRRYDEQMLSDEISSVGLTLLSSRYFFQALYVPMLAARGRRRDTKVTGPKSSSSDAVHRFLGGAFILEERLMPRWIPGTSMIAIART